MSCPVLGLNARSLHSIHESRFPNLSSDGDLIVGLKPKRALTFVRVVKGDRHSGFCDATLAVFIHQVLEICGSHL